MKYKRLIYSAPFSGQRVQNYEGEKRYLSTGDLQKSDTSFVNVTYKNRPSRADIIVNEGDILVARMKNTDKVLLVDKELDGIIVSTGFSIHRPLKGELLGGYLVQFLKNKAFQREKDKYCTGSIQPAITNEGLSKIQIPFPPLDDQIRIVAVLSRAEQLIAKRKESIALLDEFLRSTFLEMFGDPVRNEKGWEKKPLKEFGEIVTGSTPPRNDSRNYSSSYIEWIKTDNIIDEKLIVTTANEYLSEIGLQKARNVAAGAILVACIAGSINSIGRSALTDRKISLNQQINAIQPYKNVNSIFLCWLFKMSRSFVQSQASKGMKKILTKGVFEKIEMILPKTSIQEQFAMIVEKVETIKAKYKQSLDELEKLYGSLSQRAFKGELDMNRISVV